MINLQKATISPIFLMVARNHKQFLFSRIPEILKSSNILLFWSYTIALKTHSKIDHNFSINPPILLCSQILTLRNSDRAQRGWPISGGRASAEKTQLGVTQVDGGWGSRAWTRITDRDYESTSLYMASTTGLDFHTVWHLQVVRLLTLISSRPPEQVFQRTSQSMHGLPRLNLRNYIICLSYHTLLVEAVTNLISLKGRGNRP